MELWDADLARFQEISTTEKVAEKHFWILVSLSFNVRVKKALQLSGSLFVMYADFNYIQRALLLIAYIYCVILHSESLTGTGSLVKK